MSNNLPNLYQAGIPPRQINTLNYIGTPLSTVPVVNVNRAPTVNDGEFPLFTLWRNANASAVLPDMEGDLWYFARIDASFFPVHNIWLKLSSGGVSPLININVPNGTTPVHPDGSGFMTFTSTGGTMVITGSSATTINFDTTGGAIPLEKMNVDAHTAPGTNPVLANGSAAITITGGQTAPGTISNVIRTDSLAANTYTIEIQQTSTAAAKDITKNGVSHFNSTEFTNDQGFISLSAGAGIVTGLIPDAHTAPGTTPVVPTSGNITLEGGATFATGTQAKPIRTNSLAANTIDFQIQLAGSNAGASTANNFGVSQFDSNQFNVSSGFVQLAGGTTPAVEKFNMQTGTSPVVPASSAITFNGATVAAGTNPVRTDGTGANTMALEVQISQAIGATDATKIGLSAYNSANFIVDASGYVSTTASAVPGVMNLGIAQSAGTTFTVESANGTALSATNAAHITLQSLANPGRLKTFSVTANQSFTQAGLGNSLFGVTTAVNWATDVPYYLYAVSNGNNGENTISFMISRVPHRTIAPVAGKIGQSGNTLASTQGSFFSLATITAADYASSPCVCIGSFRMQYASSLWTIQTLANSDGIGQFNDGLKIFTFPPGQNGAASGAHFAANGGTAPVWTGETGTYTIQRNGVVNYLFGNNAGAISTAGVGAVTLQAIIPLAYGLNSVLSQVLGFFLNAATTHESLTYARNPTSAITTLPGIQIFALAGDGQILQNGDCTGGASINFGFGCIADIG